MTLEELGRLLAELPGVAQGSSYGTPAWRLHRRLLARLREDGRTLVLCVDPNRREQLLASRPDLFHLTEHYRPHPYVLVVLPMITTDELRPLLAEAAAAARRGRRHTVS
ncbi:MmcQ/YjbR family DNA-binding protein [Geminicoccus flavidas]|uniref:MmcQ/YjbR family DNA-binding protein n=1 Tax=Geminicoccus flavidas TaxID=2506407 RepID=UPI001359FE59|nr:MmcQ/YjbR family DNA-binding protein [Geminicoccus flavidas]